MREIRTYGLRRGRWPVRHSTAGWGLLYVRRAMVRGADLWDGEPRIPLALPDPAWDRRIGDVLQHCTVLWGWSALWVACRPPAESTPRAAITDQR